MTSPRHNPEQTSIDQVSKHDSRLQRCKDLAESIASTSVCESKAKAAFFIWRRSIDKWLAEKEEELKNRRTEETAQMELCLAEDRMKTWREN
jgi:glutamate 5-kinase